MVRGTETAQPESNKGEPGKVRVEALTSLKTKRRRLGSGESENNNN